MIRAAAVVVAAVLVALACAEVGLRAGGFAAPLWYRPDARLGWTLRPGTEGVYSREGRGHVKVNRAGWRDAERILDKPEGVYRIAVLGDSYTEAMQVEVQQTYWRLLPQRLQACGFAPGRDIETLAFAATGYGTGQEAIALESDAMRYQPDLVLLQFANADDVQNNSLFVAQEKERPYFMLDAGGVLRIDDSFADRPSFERHASFSHELGRKIADRSRTMQLALEWDAAPFFRYAHAADYQPALLAAPRDAAWEEAWRITEALLVRMHHYSARNGARFAVFNAPHPAQLGAADLSYPDTRVANFARRHGIQVLPVLEAMRQRNAQTLFYARHWTPAGHAAVADILAAKLCPAR